MKCRECRVDRESVATNTEHLCHLCSMSVICWSCGLRYSDTFDECPPNLLGCGSPKRFTSTSTAINASEAVAKELAGELVHLANALRADRLDELNATAAELLKASAKLLGDVQRLRAAVRVAAMKRKAA